MLCLEFRGFQVDMFPLILRERGGGAIKILISELLV